MNDNTTDIVNIFLSHKHKDARAAADLKGKFERLGPGRLQCFLSEEIPGGADWREWIEKHLGRTNLMLFLCTSTTTDWGWCLYETGLFQGLRKGLIIVLHSPGLKAPSPLTNLQAVEATREGLKPFLKDFFGSPKYTDMDSPMNKPFAEDDQALTREAEEIADLIKGGAEYIRYFTNYLILQLKNPQDPMLEQQGLIPENASIESNEASLRMFDLGAQPTEGGKWTWGNLLGQVSDNTWVEALGRAVRASSQGLVFDPMQATVHVERTGKVYRPLLYRQDIESDGSMGFHALFVEQVADG